MIGREKEKEALLELLNDDGSAIWITGASGIGKRTLLENTLIAWNAAETHTRLIDVSINSFDAGGRGVLISQVIPGPQVNQSVTIQTYLTAEKLEGENLKQADDNAQFLAQVVRTEDLPTSAGQEQNLATGIQDKIVVGANEFGIQHFHHWLETLSQARDNQLDDVLDYSSSWSNL